MERYFEVTLRRRSNGDVFGVEATIDHIQTTVGESVFFELFQPETKAFYLLREDIVTQAISLMKPADSGVYHTVNSSKEAILAANQNFIFDVSKIEDRVRRLLNQELAFEEMFRRRNIEPARISYERIIAAGPSHMAAFFEQELQLPAAQPSTITATHEKVGTSKGATFATRFRAERPKFVARLETQRAKQLRMLQDLALSPGALPSP